MHVEIPEIYPSIMTAINIYIKLMHSGGNKAAGSRWLLYKDPCTRGGVPRYLYRVKGTSCWRVRRGFKDVRTSSSLVLVFDHPTRRGSMPLRLTLGSWVYNRRLFWVVVRRGNAGRTVIRRIESWWLSGRAGTCISWTSSTRVGALKRRGAHRGWSLVI